MRTLHILAATLVIALMILGSKGSLNASTWTNPTSGGFWANSPNWSGGVPNAVGAVADFSTLALTADNTVHLTASETVGSLLFGDVNLSHNWILDNNGNPANVLTLAVSSGSPTITVNNDSATISSVIGGTQGMTVTGAGTLVLSGNNTFAGGMAINSGNVRLNSAGTLNSTTPNLVRFGDGTAGNETLSLNGNSVTISGILPLNGPIVFGNAYVQNGSATPATLTINNSSDSVRASSLRMVAWPPCRWLRPAPARLTLGLRSRTSR